MDFGEWDRGNHLRVKNYIELEVIRLVSNLFQL